MTALEPSPPSPAVRRVLIVEDLDDNRESLQELLQLALQIEVDAAEDGVRAGGVGVVSVRLWSRFRSRVRNLSSH